MKPPKFYRRFDYDRHRLPNAHLARLEDAVTSVDEARPRSGATIGYPGWSLLYDLALCVFDPAGENPVVETGANVGCSSIVLAQALIDSGAAGHVETVEIDPATAETAQANYAAAGVADRVRLTIGDSKAALPSMLARLPFVRLAFLDGSHLHDDVVEEFALIEPHLAPGALVVFDNTYEIADKGEDPRVHGGLKTIQSAFGGNVINLPFVSWYTPGLAIWQRAPFPLAQRGGRNAAGRRG